MRPAFALLAALALPAGLAAQVAPMPPSPIVTPRAEYRVRGEPALRPSKIGDDGERTYIEWDAHQSLPAVFGIGANGEEEAVDGYMRNDQFVIDRVYRDLVFRIDRKSAKARRLAALGARG